MRIIRIVIRAILAIILGAIVLVVMAPMLLIGGCLALGAFYAAPELIKAEKALEQARYAPLPPHVQRLIEDEYLGFNPKNDSRYGAIYSSDGGLAQDPSGRYMLTIEGLFDFASARLTKLDCPGLSAAGGPRINFRRLWLDEQLFLWGRCIYDVRTLQPGPLEDVQCGDLSSGCQQDDFMAVVAPLARQADRVYKTDWSAYEYLFVKLHAGAPVRAWAVSNLRDSTVQKGELGHLPIEVPSSKGQTTAFGEHSISPNGEYDASFDDTALTIRRKQDRKPVAQVKFIGSNARSALFGHAQSILGWTGDSRQIVFLVEGDFGYYRSLAQVFTLTIP